MTRKIRTAAELLKDALSRAYSGEETREAWQQRAKSEKAADAFRWATWGTSAGSATFTDARNEEPIRVETHTEYDRRTKRDQGSPALDPTELARQRRMRDPVYQKPTNAWDKPAFERRVLQAADDYRKLREQHTWRLRLFDQTPAPLAKRIEVHRRKGWKVVMLRDLGSQYVIHSPRGRMMSYTLDEATRRGSVPTFDDELLAWQALDHILTNSTL